MSRAEGLGSNEERLGEAGFVLHLQSPRLLGLGIPALGQEWAGICL